MKSRTRSRKYSNFDEAITNLESIGRLDFFGREGQHYEY